MPRRYTGSKHDRNARDAVASRRTPEQKAEIKVYHRAWIKAYCAGTELPPKPSFFDKVRGQ